VPITLADGTVVYGTPVEVAPMFEQNTANLISERDHHTTSGQLSGFHQHQATSLASDLSNL
jgi:hypothetical protein